MGRPRKYYFPTASAYHVSTGPSQKEVAERQAKNAADRAGEIPPTATDDPLRVQMMRIGVHGVPAARLARVRPVCVDAVMPIAIRGKDWKTPLRLMITAAAHIDRSGVVVSRENFQEVVLAPDLFFSTLAAPGGPWAQVKSTDDYRSHLKTISLANPESKFPPRHKRQPETTRRRPSLEPEQAKLNWSIAQLPDDWAAEARLLMSMGLNGCAPGDCYRATTDWVSGTAGSVLLQIPQRVERGRPVPARDLPFLGADGALLLARAESLPAGSFLLLPDNTDRTDVTSTIAQRVPGLRVDDLFNAWLVRLAERVPFNTLVKLAGLTTESDRLGSLMAFMRVPSLAVVRRQVEAAVVTKGAH